MITNHQNESFKAGLVINISKTKLMSDSPVLNNNKVNQLGIEQATEIKI